MQGTRKGDRVERNSALELRPRCYDGANSARLSSGDGLRIGIQARHAITALQKLGGEPPVATPNLKNVGTHRNPRCKKHQRFSGRHIDRLDCNKIGHSVLTMESPLESEGAKAIRSTVPWVSPAGSRQRPGSVA